MGGPAVTATMVDFNIYNKESNAPLRFYTSLIDVRVVRIEFVFMKLPRQIVRKVLTCAQPKITTLARQVVSGPRAATDDFSQTGALPVCYSYFRLTLRLYTFQFVVNCTPICKTSQMSS
jgi:hypothetical protein